MSESAGFNVPLDSRQITGHFGIESFQAIDCTGTDNQRQQNTNNYIHAEQRQSEKLTLYLKQTKPLFSTSFGNGMGGGPHSYNSGARTGQ